MTAKVEEVPEGKFWYVMSFTRDFSLAQPTEELANEVAEAMANEFPKHIFFVLKPVWKFYVPEGK